MTNASPAKRSDSKEPARKRQRHNGSNEGEGQLHTLGLAHEFEVSVRIVVSRIQKQKNGRGEEKKRKTNCRPPHNTTTVAEKRKWKGDIVSQGKVAMQSVSREEPESGSASNSRRCGI